MKIEKITSIIFCILSNFIFENYIYLKMFQIVIFNRDKVKIGYNL